MVDMAKTKEQILADARAWKARNKERVRAARAAYYAKNKDKELSMAKIWRAKNQELLQAIKAKSNQAYRAKNKDLLRRKRKARAEHYRALHRKRYASDPNYNLACRLRASLTQALRLYDGDKKCSVNELIGCTIGQLKSHLERQFRPGMSWAKRNSFHIDHIRPVCSFDLTKLDEQKACFHFSNLRPLLPSENQRKHAKFLRS